MKSLILRGRVISGEGMAGSVLHCPTANIAVEEGAIIPGLGVYVGEAKVDTICYPALVCISDGRTGSNLKMEVHLLDQTLELKEKYLEVEIFERLRDIIPFPGEKEMARVIEQDLLRAKEWFKES